jgi:hypothetical protein
MDGGQPQTENLRDVEVSRQIFQATIKRDDMEDVALLLEMREHLARATRVPRTLTIDSV